MYIHEEEVTGANSLPLNCRWQLFQLSSFVWTPGVSRDGEGAALAFTERCLRGLIFVSVEENRNGKEREKSFHPT